MRTFHITTLGCKVNQYESAQIATLLRQRGLRQADDPGTADLRLIHTCSVTSRAAADSRQTVRKLARLPLLQEGQVTASPAQRVIVTGCWAASDAADARTIPGVRAVIGNRDELAAELDRLVAEWSLEDGRAAPNAPLCASLQAGGAADGLPALDRRDPAHQRAWLKVQDGCDAHCTYCIIPRLRPRVWSRPIADIVAEARRLVEQGCREIVLSGIFLGAYGQPTALRRRQDPAAQSPLATLIDALCTEVRGTWRLRLSSLEPGDLDERLIQTLRRHPQVAPHFHLPLQSGAPLILRRMNRQYGRDDYLRMIERVNGAFDRPAITTDVIVGFPGESDEEFARTLEVVDFARFIHIHAFAFSPRPLTAAARWKDQTVPPQVLSQRLRALREAAAAHDLTFRRSFLGQRMSVIVERTGAAITGDPANRPRLRRGRTDRYFPVLFDGTSLSAGQCVDVRIARVTPTRTLGRPCV